MSRNRKRVRRNQNNLKGIIIIVAALLLITVSVALITNLIQKSNEKKLEVETSISSEEYDDHIYYELEESENALFTSTFKYPQTTDNENINEGIQSWVEQIDDHFHASIEDLDYKKLKEQTSLVVKTIDLTKLSDDYYQTMLHTHESVKDEHKNSLKTFVFNYNEDEFITFNELFNVDELVNNESFKDEIGYDKEQLNSDDLAFLIEEEQLSFYQSNEEGELKTKSIDLMKVYPYIALNYDDIILNDEQKEKIAAIKEEEDKKKQEKKKKQQEEQDEGNKEDLDKKLIALTFDDGPHNEVTERVLNTLDDFDAKATFFMLGQNAEAYPEVAQKVVEQGHEIANHSITHPDLVTLSMDQLRSQLIDSQEQIEAATGKKPIYFRPPYGSYNDNVLQIAKESNQKVIMWSVDTRDWESRNAASINQVVQQYTRPGAILLMHDIHHSTADALPEMLQYLSDQGYEFVTVSELLPYIDGEGVGPYNGN